MMVRIISLLPSVELRVSRYPAAVRLPACLPIGILDVASDDHSVLVFAAVSALRLGWFNTKVADAGSSSSPASASFKGQGLQSNIVITTANENSNSYADTGLDRRLCAEIGAGQRPASNIRCHCQDRVGDRLIAYERSPGTSRSPHYRCDQSNCDRDHTFLSIKQNSNEQ